MYVYIKTKLDLFKYIELNNIDYIFVNNDLTIYDDGKLNIKKGTKLMNYDGNLLIENEELEDIKYYFIQLNIFNKLKKEIYNINNNQFIDLSVFIELININKYEKYRNINIIDYSYIIEKLDYLLKIYERNIKNSRDLYEEIIQILK